MKKIFTIFAFSMSLLFWQSSIYAQNSTCATAAALQIDMNCGGLETGSGANSGDPTGNDDTDGNVCNTNYSAGDDFIYVYTATSTDALQLDLYATNSWTGLMVTEGCPTTGTCVASATSSSSDESVNTGSLTNGVTYYIHISTWPSPQSTGQFCLDASLLAPPTPPANDNCVDAEALTVNADDACGTVTSGTINLATASGEDESTCSGTEDDDVWYSFVATATTHTIDLNNVTGGTTDLYHSVWSGSCGALTNVLCSDPNSSTATGLMIGTTYLLRVYTWTSTAGQTTTFDVCIGTLPAAPANDECADAFSIDDTDVLTGNTDAATTANAQTACNGGGGGGDCDAGGTGTTDFSEGVWFVYTSSSSGESITVATDNVGTDFDTEIQVFEGSCGSLTCVGGDDDGGDGTGHNFDSKFCWVSTANFAPVDYYIYIDGHSGATGNYAVSLDVVQAPLPVELTSFQGEVTEKSNRLIWETASEENTEMHIIERSIDGQDNWEVVGEVPAAGNSFVAQNYKLEDMNPVAEAYYRLKSVDFDGYTEFSEVIMLERKIEEFEVVNIAPNPASASVNLTVQTPKSGFYTIRLTNTVGQIVYLEQSNMDSGIHSKEINISDLSNGIYFITIENGLESLVHRIVKQ